MVDGPIAPIILTLQPLTLNSQPRQYVTISPQSRASSWRPIRGDLGRFAAEFDRLTEDHVRSRPWRPKWSIPRLAGAFVAEMDYGTAPSFKQALRAVVDDGFFGYLRPSDVDAMRAACAAGISGRPAGKYPWSACIRHGCGQGAEGGDPPNSPTPAPVSSCQHRPTSRSSPCQRAWDGRWSSFRWC